MSSQKKRNKVILEADCLSVRGSAGSDSGSAPISPPPTPTLFWFWVATVVVCTIPQVFYLGFYLDDWLTVIQANLQGGPFSAERFSYMLAIDSTRPINAVLRFICSSILSANPHFWQAAMLLVNGLLSLALGALIQEISGASDPSNRRTAMAIGLSWLLVPWSVSFRFWSVLLPVQILVLVFAALVVYVLREWTRQRSPLAVPFGVYLAICLGYEALYFQFVTVVTIGLCMVWVGRVRFRDVARTGTALALAQGAAVLWYMASKYVTTNRKPIVGDWQSLTVRNLERLVPEMLSCLTDAALLFEVSIGAAAILLLYAHLGRTASVPARRGLLAGPAALACVLGGIASILAFSLGGRPIVGLGVEARTLTLVSFWSIVAAGILASSARPRLSVAADRMLTITGLGIGLSLVLAQGYRLVDWSTAWQRQQDILAEAPVAQMSVVEADDLILVVLERAINGAPVFMAPWDINTAMTLTYPELRDVRFEVYNRWEGPMVWDQKELRYPDRLFGKPKSVYIWQPSRRAFFESTDDLTVGQDLTIQVGSP